MPRSPNPRTRSSLLDAAEALMLRRGFAAASVDDICAAAGVTKGSFFHYFKSKEQVGAQAVRRFYARNHERFLTAPYQKQRDPLKRVLGFLDMTIAMSNHPALAQGCLIGTVAQEMAGTSRALRDACNECFSDWAGGLRRDLEQVRKLHAPRLGIDAASLADHCIAVLEGALILVKTSQSSKPLTQSLKHLRRYVTMLFDQKC